MHTQFIFNELDGDIIIGNAFSFIILICFSDFHLFDRVLFVIFNILCNKHFWESTFPKSIFFLIKFEILPNVFSKLYQPIKLRKFGKILDFISERQSFVIFPSFSYKIGRGKRFTFWVDLLLNLLKLSHFIILTFHLLWIKRHSK